MNEKSQVLNFFAIVPTLTFGSYFQITQSRVNCCPRELDFTCHCAESAAELGTTAGIRLVIRQVDADTVCLCWPLTTGSV